MRSRLTEPLVRGLVTGTNPHIECFDSHPWGYSTVEFARGDCTYVGYAVDRFEDSPDADREVVAAYRVPEGRVELEDVTGEYRTSSGT